MSGWRGGEGWVEEGHAKGQVSLNGVKKFFRSCKSVNASIVLVFQSVSTVFVYMNFKMSSGVT